MAMMMGQWSSGVIGDMERTSGWAWANDGRCDATHMYYRFRVNFGARACISRDLNASMQAVA